MTALLVKAPSMRGNGMKPVSIRLCRRKGIAGGGGIVRREVAFTLAKAAEILYCHRENPAV